MEEALIGRDRICLFCGKKAEGTQHVYTGTEKLCGYCKDKKYSPLRGALCEKHSDCKHRNFNIEEVVDITCPSCGTYTMEYDLWSRLLCEVTSKSSCGLSADLKSNYRLMSEYCKILKSAGKKPPILTLDNIDWVLILIHNLIEFDRVF
jgi:hypothetical protein